MKSKRMMIAIGLITIAVSTVAVTNVLDHKNIKSETKIEDVNTTSESNNSGVLNINDFITVDTEKGYMTSLEQGATNKDTFDKNFYLYDVNEEVTLEDLLITSNIAENFAQSMILYDSQKPNKYVDIAKSYADKSVTNIFLRVPTFAEKGAQENTKRMEISDLYTIAQRYHEEEEIFEYRVILNWTWIDNYDRVASKGEEAVYVNIKKIDGKYKVIEYFID